MSEFELEVLLEQICTVLGVTTQQAKSESLFRDLSDARKIFTFKARKEGATLAVIGNLINRHHTTVMAMQRQYLNLLINEDFREKVLRVESALKNVQKQAA